MNPAAGANLPRLNRREMRHLSPGELLAVGKAVPGKHRTLILTLGIAGLRFGEAAALRRQDVDLLHRRLTVERSVTEVDGSLVMGSPKSGRVRSVAIPERLIKELDNHLGTYVAPDLDALVFSSDLGAMLRVTNFSRRVFRPAVAATAIERPEELRLHDLRHTAAAAMIAVRPDPELVKRQLGHSSITVTYDQYGHLLPDARREMTDKLDRLFDAAAGQMQTNDESSVSGLGG